MNLRPVSVRLSSVLARQARLEAHGPSCCLALKEPEALEMRSSRLELFAYRLQMTVSEPSVC